MFVFHQRWMFLCMCERSALVCCWVKARVWVQVSACVLRTELNNYTTCESPPTAPCDLYQHLRVFYGCVCTPSQHS